MAETNTDVSGTVTFETNDDLSETNLGRMLAIGSSSGYVKRGLGLNPDFVADTVDIGSMLSSGAENLAFIVDGHVAYLVVPERVTGVGLPDTNGVNHVFLEYDPADGSLSYHIDDDNTAPTTPSLKIGEVDTQNETSTELNRNPTQTFHTLTVLSELGIPSYDDVSNAPTTDGRIVYVTGDGTTTPEGLYQRQSGSYTQVGGQRTTEEIQDIVGGMAGTNLTYDDPNNVINASGGSGGFTQTTQTADYTASDGDSVWADSSSAALTVTLPTPAASAVVRVTNIDDTNGVDISPNGSENINDSASNFAVNGVNTTVALESDGTNWRTV